MAFRFVHTADIHLDSPLKSLALKNPILAEAVAAATRRAFARTIDLCIEETVDALLIAGDLYDGQNASMRTAAFLAAELRRLPPDIHVFILKGNHDAQSRITERLDLPANVKTFDGRGRVYEIESRDGDAVAVHGVSFRERHAPESLLPKYKPPVAGAINIGLMHTSLDGAPGHDPYAPVAAADLAAHGFDYWALGHIHQRSVREIAGAAIVMPGIPQGRHVNEAGQKSVTLATVEQGAARLEERNVAPVRFDRLDVALDDAETLEDARVRIDAGLAAVGETDAADALILRVRLAGATPAAWRFERDAELLQDAVREAGERAGVWIESVEIAVEGPAANAANAGPVDLSDDIAAVLADPEFQAAAEAAFRETLRALPREAQDMLADTAEGEAAARDLFAAEGARLALARLAPAAPDPGDPSV